MLYSQTFGPSSFPHEIRKYTYDLERNLKKNPLLIFGLFFFLLSVLILSVEPVKLNDIQPDLKSSEMRCMNIHLANKRNCNE